MGAWASCSCTENGRTISKREAHIGNASNMSGIIEQGRLVDYSSRTIRKVIDIFRAVGSEHGRPLHVLECGSGAGNVTRRLLPHLRTGL